MVLPGHGTAHFNSGCHVSDSPPRMCVHCDGSGLRATSSRVEEAPSPGHSGMSQPGQERPTFLRDVGLSSHGPTTKDPTHAKRVDRQGRGVRQPPPSPYPDGSVAHRPVSTGLHHTPLPPQGSTTFAGFSPLRPRVVWSRETLIFEPDARPVVTLSPWVCCLLREHAPQCCPGFSRCRRCLLMVTRGSTGLGWTPRRPVSLLGYSLIGLGF